MRKAFVAICLVALLLTGSVANTQHSKILKNTYSEEEQKQFCKDFIWPIIDQIQLMTLPYKEVNERIKVESEMIQARFSGKMLSLSYTKDYNSKGRNIAASSWVDKDGSPLFELHIPAVMNVFYSQVDADPKWWVPFLVGTVMHEMDHLSETPPVPQPASIENEIHIHAVTMKNVTAVFREHYGFPLYPEINREYLVWVFAGRDEKSPIWRKYITKLHSDILY